MRYARRRDDCEAGIIAAYRAVGWAVQQNSGDGEPDLTVSKGREMLYVECKDVPKGHGHKHAHRGKHDDPDPRYRELTPRQVKWWKAWERAGGKPPVIVHDQVEALAAIGAVERPIRAGAPEAIGLTPSELRARTAEQVAAEDVLRDPAVMARNAAALQARRRA